METPPEEQKVTVCGRLCRVTPLSKWLAMLIIISMPFFGGWVGYEYGKLDLQGRSSGVAYVPPEKPSTPVVPPQAPQLREQILLSEERVVCTESPCSITWVGDMDIEKIGTLVYVAIERIFEYSDGSIKGPYKSISFSTLELEELSKDATGKVSCDAKYPDVLGTVSVSYKAVLENEFYKQVAEKGEANIYWAGNPEYLHQAASTDESEFPRNVLERAESFIVYSDPQATCSGVKEVYELQSKQLRSFREAFAEIK